MCKFHQDVARAIATDPVSGRLDADRYAVALVATAKFRIEQYMPTMYGCTGYGVYAMASGKGQTAYAFTKLPQQLERLSLRQDSDLASLRAAMDDAASRHDFASLGLPGRQAAREAFLDEASDALYDGHTAPGYADRVLTFKGAAHRPEFENLRAAAAAFIASPAAEAALQRQFEYSLAAKFADAPKNVGPLVRKIRSYLPNDLSGVFKQCAMCARDGAGGAALSHVGCIAMPAVAGGLGTMVSDAAMTGFMMVSSPVIALAATIGFDRLRGHRTGIPKMAGTAGLALAIAFGVSALGMHHDMGGMHHMHGMNDGNLHERATAWLSDLDMPTRQVVLENAAAFHMSLDDYYAQNCLTRTAGSVTPSVH